MIRRILLSTALVTAFGVASAAVAQAAVTQRFRGEGSSDKGLQYYYAKYDALRQAERAGYTSAECVEVEKVVWPYEAWVTIECTH